MDLTPRPVASSVDELLADATAHEPMDKNDDSLSGSGFSRAVIGGEPYVVKHTSYSADWLARALGDTDCWALTVWRSGLMDALPPSIDHTVRGMAVDAAGTVSVLMRDVSPALVPAGSALIAHDTHRRFLAHMAEMHARFWGFTDVYGLLAPGVRYQALGPATGEREAASGGTDPVPRALAGGWAAMRAADPALHDDCLALVTDATPLAAALAETPRTFVHGDWKAGNLGEHSDGRTVLLDWGWPGAGGPLVDLGWYLAVNCDRLPEPKEAAIAVYRAALESQGVETGPWWERQLSLALLGAFLQLGWSKSGAEFAWWQARVAGVARSLS